MHEEMERARGSRQASRPRVIHGEENRRRKQPPNKQKQQTVSIPDSLVSQVRILGRDSGKEVEIKSQARGQSNTCWASTVTVQPGTRTAFDS